MQIGHYRYYVFLHRHQEVLGVLHDVHLLLRTQSGARERNFILGGKILICNGQAGICEVGNFFRLPELRLKPPNDSESELLILGFVSHTYTPNSSQLK